MNAKQHEAPLIDQIDARALLSLLPAPKIDHNIWTTKTIVIPGDLSATPGPMVQHNYLRALSEAIDDDAIERLTLVKSSRIGASLWLLSKILSDVQNRPAPIILLEPTDSDCMDVAKTVLDPLVQASPKLRGLLEPGEFEEADTNTLLSKRFPGGSLKILSARAAARTLRGRTAKNFYADETDAYLVSADGSPIELGIRRTMTFPDRKIILISSPSDLETSFILRSYDEGDQRVYQCKCECGEYTEVLFREHIRWDKDEQGNALPETAHFQCPANGCLVGHDRKKWMVDNGRWFITHPERTKLGHASFRINSLISPLYNARWSKLVEEFLAAKNDIPQLRVFVNTALGQGFREEPEVDATVVQNRGEAFGLDFGPPRGEGLFR
jgi:phage terminase large subunit GpA-like protein